MQSKRYLTGGQLKLYLTELNSTFLWSRHSTELPLLHHIIIDKRKRQALHIQPCSQNIWNRLQPRYLKQLTVRLASLVRFTSKSKIQWLFNLIIFCYFKNVVLKPMHMNMKSRVRIDSTTQNRFTVYSSYLCCLCSWLACLPLFAGVVVSPATFW